MLEEAREDARPPGSRRSRRSPAQGDAADAILDVAEEQRCDLIVVGNRGMTGAKRFLLGSVPEQGLAPRALLGADRPDDLTAGAAVRPAGVTGPALVPTSARLRHRR